MKKVLVLACAAFFSGQLMAQSTLKASDPAQAKTTAASKQQVEATKAQVDAMPTKAEVVTSVNTLAPEAAPVAATAIRDTKIATAPKEVELSKTAAIPVLAKPEPIKE